MKFRSNSQPIRAWLLLISLNAYVFVQSLFLLNFYVNKQYFVNEVCIQKNQVNNCCQASCVIEKAIQLPQTSDQEQPQIATWFPEFEIPQEEPSHFKGNTVAIFANNFLKNESDGFTNPIERPPTLLS
jgi:hypothetical protein